MRFENAAPKPVVRKENPLSYYHNYFIGNDPARWAGNVRLFRDVFVQGIYNGVDLKVYSSGSKILKYDLVVAAGTDPGQIALLFDGVIPQLTANGKLRIKTSVNEVLENAPVTYQIIQGKRIPVASNYVLKGNRLSFAFPEGYDHNYPLIIDPDLIFATFSGSNGSGKYAHSTAYNQNGCLYTAAVATDGWPVTTGAYQTTYPSYTAAISKFSKNGDSLIYATYFGGTGQGIVHPNSMIVNNLDEVILTGCVSNPAMPVTPNAYQSAMNGFNDLYVAKFSADGSNLIGSTFIGGSSRESMLINSGTQNYTSIGTNNELNPADIAVDKAGNIWVTSNTESGNFPVTQLAYNSTLSGGYDAVVFKMTPDLSTLQYSSYFGGSGRDGGIGISYSRELDRICVVGVTGSSNFPVTTGAFLTTRPGRQEGFAMLIDNQTNQLIASTFLGTNQDDAALRVAFDCEGHVYVSGTTQGNYPITTPGSHMTNGSIFIDKLRPDLTASLASGRTGSNASGVIPTSMMVDLCGNLLVATLASNTPQNGMPLTPDAFMSAARPFYFAAFTSDMDSLIFGSYMGTNMDHNHPGVSRMDPQGVVYHSVCSDQPAWPVTPAAFSTVKWNTGVDNVSFKFDFGIVPEVTVSQLSGGGAGSKETHCVRGCKSAFLRFERKAQPRPLTIRYQIAGDAINGTDYQWIPDSIVLAANQSSVSLEIKPLPVNTPSVPDPKHVIINTYSLCGCEKIIARDTIWIYDSLYAHITASAGVICPGDEVELTGNIAPALPFAWSPENLLDNKDSLSVRIRPTKTTTVSLTVFQPGAPITCPPRTVSHTIKVEQYPVVRLPKDTTLCPLQDSLPLTVRATPTSQEYTFRWLVPEGHFRYEEGASNFFFAEPGTHLVIAEAVTSAGCSGRDSFTITILPPFQFDLITPYDTVIQLGDSFQFFPVGDAVSWHWSPGTYLSGITEPSPWVKPMAPITYTLTGINRYGCEGSARVYVDVFYESGSVFPTAFSPNGDGLNDHFKILHLRFDKLIQLQIFNRFGQLVFDTSDPSKGWDGTFQGAPAPVGTYFYHATVELPLSGGQKTFRGDVTLIR